jgi:predicted transcriptional regulator
MAKSEMTQLSAEQKKILETLAAAEHPCGSKDLAAATGLEPKVISSRVATLKKTGLVDSPVRCKYGVTKAGREAIS